jgi:DNA-binding MarR family transcriptional regulator
MSKDLGEILQSKFSSDQHKAVVHALYIGNYLKNQHSSALKKHGISVQQYNILRILKGAKGEKMRMTVVRDRMIEKAPNTTRLTDALIERGFIARERCDDDRRVVFVNITREGLSFLEKVDEAAGPEMERFYGNLTDEEAKELDRLLTKLRS